MSTNSDAVASNQAFPDGSRPLPAHPSLEFERKRAKRALRELRGTSPDAKLADAQFAIAREYGFSSWPKLVEYFTISARHELSAPPPAWYPLNIFEQFAQGVLSRHRKRHPSIGPALATFVPRLYGKTAAEALDAPITIEDARLVVARENRLPSWEAVIEYAGSRTTDAHDWEYYGTPRAKAFKAIFNSDLTSLALIVDAHPDLLEPPGRLNTMQGDLLVNAILCEWKEQRLEAKRVTDWLASRGADLQKALNWMLVSFMPIGCLVMRDPTGTDAIEFLIARGADPNWIAPNGISVLEHALLRARSVKAVDAIASRVTAPRKAFWIAAGLGDTAILARYFDRNGKLTNAARRHRPDFIAIGGGGSSLPNADDLDIMWEAFYVAALSCRTASMDALLDRGLPVDYAPVSGTMLSLAVGTGMAPLVEYLIRRGAILDIKGASAKQLDDWMFQRDPTKPETRRIYELCGGQNADAVIRRYEQPDPTPPTLAPRLLEAIERAKEDAQRLGLPEVRPDNLLIAFFRDDFHGPLGLLNSADVNLTVLHDLIAHRLSLADHAADARNIPLSAETHSLLEAARARTAKRHERLVNHFDVIRFLLNADSAPVTELLTRAGGNMEKLRAAAQRL